MSYETLQFEQRGGVAYVTLDRPDAANALDLQMAKELMSVSLACDGDPAVRAVVIGAKGKMFCAGGDLASFAKADDMATLLKEITTYLHAAISRFARMRAPVVAAVGGPAAGAGFSLACATDLAIASESARFSMAYTRAGLTPDGSSTYFLPRLLGSRRSLELMLLNRTLDAREALEWGIVNRVVPDGDLSAEAEKLAQTLANGPTEAFAATKRLVQSSGVESLESQMELESRSIAAASYTADAREGIDAFFAKRRPAFKGE